MKVKLIEENKAKFEPIILHLRIEKMYELLELVKRLNIALSDINQIDTDYENVEENGSYHDLFEILDEKYEKYKLKGITIDD